MYRLTIKTKGSNKPAVELICSKALVDLTLDNYLKTELVTSFKVETVKVAKIKESTKPEDDLMKLLA